MTIIARLLAAALVAVSIVATLPGCGQKSPEELFADAQAAYGRGDAAKAAVQLKSCLVQDPKHGEARYLLGVILNERWDGAGAESELRRAMELGVSPSRVQPALGRALLSQRANQKLLDEIKPLPIYDAGQLALVHAYRARALLGIGKAEEARAELAKSNAAVPRSSPALLVEAGFRIVEDDPEGAVKLLDEGLAKAPRDFELWLTKGDALQSLSRNEEAVAAYGKALEAFPANVAALFRRASVLLALGKPKEALQDSAEIRRTLGENVMSRYLNAFAAFSEKRYREAQTEVSKAVAMDADYPPALLLSGAVHHALGASSQAVADLQRFVKAYPNHLFARKLLAAVYLDMKQGKRALEVIEPGIAKELNDSLALALAGRAQMANGNFTEATELMERAVTSDPKEPALRRQLGLSRLGAGNTERALDDLEAATKLDATGRSDVLFMLAAIGEQRYDAAITSARAMQQKSPENPIPWNLEGAALLGKNDAAGARKAFEKAVSLDALYIPAIANLVKLDMGDKNVAAARGRLQAVLAKDKRSLYAMLGLAAIEARTGKPRESALWLERAAAANPTRIEPRIELAAYYVHAGEPRKALGLATEAASLAPRNRLVLDILGVAQVAAGELNQAMATYTRLTEIAPKWGHAFYRLAGVKSMLGDSKGASEALRKALDADPGNKDVNVSMARVQAKAGRIPDSLAIARKLQKDHPNDPSGYLLEGDIRSGQQQFAQAVKSYEAAHGLRPNTETVVKLYMNRVRAGDPKGGDAQLQAWLQQYPDDLTVRLMLGDSLYQTGQTKAAIDQFEFVLARQPGNAVAQVALAWSYDALNDPRAGAAADKAAALKPLAPTLADNLGWLLLKQGKVTEALRLIRGAADAMKDDPVARYHLAAVLARSGDRTGARREIDAVLAKKQRFRDMEDARALQRELAQGSP